MIERALVKQATDRRVKLIFEKKSTCDSCATKSTCSTGTITNAFYTQGPTLDLNNTVGAKQGDWVEVEISTIAVNKLAVLVYAIPLLTMLLGALSFEILAVSDSLTVTSAFVSLGLGIVLARFLLKRLNLEACEPRILAICD